MSVVPQGDAQTNFIRDMIARMTPQQRQQLAELAVPRMIDPYAVQIPHPAQQVFLSLNNVREVLYGGAAGGGKSSALLLAALQYVDVPGYSALILRRSWPDLVLPGAIMDRAREWLMGTPARPREGGRQWVFPSGARLQFGYLQNENDKFRYASAEFTFIGFDELTQFEETQYTFMFSRLRKPSLVCLNCSTSIVQDRQYRKKEDGKRTIRYRHTTLEGRQKCTDASIFPDPKQLAMYRASVRDSYTTLFDVPLRMRSASNPGGVGHSWVFDRFIDKRTKEKGSVFVPSTLRDNPSLNQVEYSESLSHLLPVERERLLNGDWNVSEEGTLFRREWFKGLPAVPLNPTMKVRFWDMAATQDGGDYTVGTLMYRMPDNTIVVVDVIRGQWSPLNAEKIIKQTAIADGQETLIRMEEEPGSAGKNMIGHYQRNILLGYNFRELRSTGNKETRAAPFAAQCEAGNVYICRGEWNRAWLDELTMFPNVDHDDQTDSASGAFTIHSFERRITILN